MPDIKWPQDRPEGVLARVSTVSKAAFDMLCKTCYVYTLQARFVGDEVGSPANVLVDDNTATAEDPVTLPDKYAEYADVFAKSTADQLPKHWRRPGGQPTG